MHESFVYFLGGLTWLLVGLALAPALIVSTQAMLAILPRRLHAGSPRLPNVEAAVIVPAHNEQASIARTVRSVRSSARAPMRVLVVADHCHDATAEVARAAGAEVLIREGSPLRGKAYALGFAVEHLRATPPCVVVVVDADCLVGPSGLSRLCGRAHVLQRPVQALNLIDRRRTTTALTAISTLGNRWHNLVRPLGFAKIGLPCLLTGSGMAFPWACIERVGLQNDSLGEDKQLGVDMALAGFPPTFSLDAKVASYLPDRYAGYLGQRVRWEHGHLGVALRQVPRLLWAGTVRGDIRLWAMALDLAVPPLALLGMCWAGGAALGAGWGLWRGDWWPLAITALTLTLLVLSLGITWMGFSRRRVPLRALALLPWYLLGKLPIYARLLLRGPQQKWVRTERAHEAK